MKKTIVAILVIALMVFGLASCDNGTTGGWRGSGNTGNRYLDRLTDSDGYGFYPGGEPYNYTVVILKEFASGNYYIELWVNQTLKNYARIIEITKDELVQQDDNGIVFRQKYLLKNGPATDTNFYLNPETGAGYIAAGWYFCGEQPDWYVKH